MPHVHDGDVFRGEALHDGSTTPRASFGVDFGIWEGTGRGAWGIMMVCSATDRVRWCMCWHVLANTTSPRASRTTCYEAIHGWGAVHAGRCATPQLLRHVWHLVAGVCGLHIHSPRLCADDAKGPVTLHGRARPQGRRVKGDVRRGGGGGIEGAQDALAVV